MRSTRCIVFDLAGTLIHPEPAAEVIYHEQGRAAGAELEPAEIKARFRHALKKADWSPCDETGHRATWQRIVFEVFAELDRPQALFERLWKRFAEPGAWQIFPDVLPAWEQLRTLGLSIAIGSNFDARIIPICDGLGLTQKCDAIFWSSAIGAAKPSAEFYEQVALDLGFSPDELLMVGDSWTNDVQGALQSGWRAMWIARQRQANAERGTSVRTISDLRDIVNYI